MSGDLQCGLKRGREDEEAESDDVGPRPSATNTYSSKKKRGIGIKPVIVSYSVWSWHNNMFLT